MFVISLCLLVVISTILTYPQDGDGNFNITEAASVPKSIEALEAVRKQGMDAL